jgi:hypothetical protein
MPFLEHHTLDALFETWDTEVNDVPQPQLNRPELGQQLCLVDAW